MKHRNEKAAEELSVRYPKLIYFMCVAHALHRVFETIHVLYPNVYKLKLNGKKIFMKLPGSQLYK
jgi:hypothetical protein